MHSPYIHLMNVDWHSSAAGSQGLSFKKSPASAQRQTVSDFNYVGPSGATSEHRHMRDLPKEISMRLCSNDL